MNAQRHIIWSNHELDYEDWKDNLEKEYPDLSDDERYSLMYEINDGYLDDERVNLDIQLDTPILMIADLGRWNGRLTDYCPADTLWSFSSIQTLLGFWIITNTIIVLASTSNICAGISSFLYMFGMTLSFYGLQAILGTFIPLFSGGFRTSLFILFTICSIPCAIAAFILYYWNKEHIFNSILYSLPVGALAAEAIVIFIYF